MPQSKKQDNIPAVKTIMENINLLEAGKRKR